MALIKINVGDNGSYIGVGSVSTCRENWLPAFTDVRPIILTMEGFKDIVGYENLYSINKNGDVFSYRRNIILKHGINTKGYHVVNLFKNKKSTLKFIHRLLFSTFIDSNVKGFRVDHIDRNVSNNDLSNLRKCTNSQNGMNRTHRKTGTSKYKGVSWDSYNKKWVAKCGINYKDKNLGYFKNELEAAKAYDEYAILIHGDYACTNKALGLI